MTGLTSILSGAASAFTGTASPLGNTVANTANAAARTATKAATAAATAASPELDKLKSAAKQFEAVFLRQMIGSMRGASDNEGLFDSSATQQFRDMSDSKLAEQMANKGALHIADMLVKAYGARLAGTQSAATTAATAVSNATTAAAATAAATLKVGTAQ